MNGPFTGENRIAMSRPRRESHQDVPAETIIAEMVSRGFTIALHGEFLEIAPRSKMSSKLLRLLDERSQDIVRALERQAPEHPCFVCDSHAFVLSDDREWECLYCTEELPVDIVQMGLVDE